MIDTLKLRKERSLYLTEELNQLSTGNLLRSINEQRAEEEEAVSAYEYQFNRKLVLPELKLYINCYGGEVLSSLGLYDYIRAWEGESNKLVTIGVGCVASAAVFILLAANKRFCYPHTRFLIHSQSGGVIGPQKDVESFTNEMKITQEYIYEVITSRTNITRDFLDKITDNKEDRWIGAEEAKELGLIHEIIK